jgi:hypothetical protein
MREPTTKDIAEYFRLGLEGGLCRENEVESWADKLIAETSSPTPNWLLNLSIDSEASENKLLQGVPGEADQITAWSLLLARLGLANRTKQFNREQIMPMLSRWSVNHEIPKPIRSEVSGLFQRCDVFLEGWNSENQFIKDMEVFFARFRPFEPSVPQSTLQALQ